MLRAPNSMTRASRLLPMQFHCCSLLSRPCNNIYTFCHWHRTSESLILVKISHMHACMTSSEKDRVLMRFCHVCVQALLEIGRLGDSSQFPVGLAHLQPCSLAKYPRSPSCRHHMLSHPQWAAGSQPQQCAGAGTRLLCRYTWGRQKPQPSSAPAAWGRGDPPLSAPGRRHCRHACKTALFLDRTDRRSTCLPA